jgi:hypothetical protein
VGQGQERRGIRSPRGSLDSIVVAVLRTCLCITLAAFLLLGCGEGSDKSTTAPSDGGSANLLEAAAVTADFEDGTNGWSATSGADVAAGGEAHSGEGGLGVEARGEGADEGALTSPLDTIPTVAGNRYKASAWVRAPQGTPMELRLSERDTEGDHINTTAESFTGTGEWQFVEADARFGDRGRRASVHIYRSGAPRSVSFDVDDVMLSRSE